MVRCPRSEAVDPPVRHDPEAELEKGRHTSSKGVQNLGVKVCNPHLGINKCTRVALRGKNTGRMEAKWARLGVS